MTKYPQFDFAVQQGSELLSLLSGLKEDATKAEAALLEIKTHFLAQDSTLRDRVADMKKQLDTFVVEQEESLDHNIKVIDAILSHLTGSRLNEIQGR